MTQPNDVKLKCGYIIRIECHNPPVPWRLTPENIKFLLGDSLDSHGYREGIDYDIEVSRTYENS